MGTVALVAASWNLVKWSMLVLPWPGERGANGDAFGDRVHRHYDHDEDHAARAGAAHLAKLDFPTGKRTPEKHDERHAEQAAGTGLPGADLRPPRSPGAAHRPGWRGQGREKPCDTGPSYPVRAICRQGSPRC